ncbi:MAG: sigma-70 family RNA polymerase sigma factor [Thermodesulfobacteriota bacterium]
MNREAFLGVEIDLLKRISSGDEKAFKQLYDLTHRKIYFYLYRLVRRKQMVEDILVETYTEVWKNASKFKGRSRVCTWMIGIARNLAMNELKKLKVHEDIEEFEEQLQVSPLEEDPLDRKRLIQKALLKLSLKHREVLDLVFFHDLTYKEVSEILDIPTNTVKTRVFYAKESLKQSLNQIGVNKDDI